MNDDRQLVDGLLAIESGLSAWELDFIESLDLWLDNHEELTDAQRDKAEEILEQHE